MRPTTRRAKALIAALIVLAWAFPVVVLVNNELDDNEQDRVIEDLAAFYREARDNPADADQLPDVEDILKGITIPVPIDGKDGRDGRDGRDGLDGADGQTPACLFEPLQCRAPNDPDPNDPEVQDEEIQDEEVQDPETDDPDPNDPDPNDPEVQDEEIQDEEVDDPDPGVLSLTFQVELFHTLVTVVCTDPDGDHVYACDVTEVKNP